MLKEQENRLDGVFFWESHAKTIKISAVSPQEDDMHGYQRQSAERFCSCRFREMALTVYGDGSFAGASLTISSDGKCSIGEERLSTVIVPQGFAGLFAYLDRLAQNGLASYFERCARALGEKRTSPLSVSHVGFELMESRQRYYYALLPLGGDGEERQRAGTGLENEDFANSLAALV